MGAKTLHEDAEFLGAGSPLGHLLPLARRLLDGLERRRSKGFRPFPCVSLDGKRAFPLCRVSLELSQSPSLAFSEECHNRTVVALS